MLLIADIDNYLDTLSEKSSVEELEKDFERISLTFRRLDNINELIESDYLTNSLIKIYEKMT